MSPIILLGIGVLVLWVILTYNRFQTLKMRLMASVQEIGNQLKRQVELIPNLIQSTKGYLTHEKSIYEAFTEARKAISEAVQLGKTEKMLQAQDLVVKALGDLRVIVESNPPLQAAGVATRLMDDLKDTSDKVMYARRTLIDLTAEYNRLVVTIPNSLVAKLFGFKSEEGLKTPTAGPHLEVSTSETQTPKADFLN